MIMAATAQPLSMISERPTASRVSGPILHFSGHSYLALLVAEYETLLGDLSARNPRAIEMANAVAARLATGDATWDDVHNLETALIELQPFEELARRAWSLRADYEAVIGERLFNEYLHSLPSETNTNESLLRADLRRVLSELHRHRTLQRAENEARKANLTHALLGFGTAVLLSVVAPGVLVVLHEIHSELAKELLVSWSSLGTRIGWLMPLAAFFGSVGGLVSVMQRIKRSQSSDVKSLEILPSWPMALAPLIGAVGGLLICLLFRSGLLSGSLFPNFSSTVQADLSDPDFFKLMIWAFVAGFSEKLVPDTLDWLASNARPEIETGPIASFDNHSRRSCLKARRRSNIEPTQNDVKLVTQPTNEAPLH
jgi:hypothetical protein